MKSKSFEIEKASGEMKTFFERNGERHDIEHIYISTTGICERFNE